ncbi:MAG TPA: DUF1844 domain-containing protein [Terriglobia bacterium]
MPEEKNEPGFKVVDRRPFAGDGSSRNKAEEIPAEPRKHESPAESPSASSARQTTEAVTPELEVPGFETEGDLGFEGGIPPGADSGFDTLVSYLGTTAMFQLGLVTGPSGERIPADLTNARQTVDMLEVLQQKTYGNLTSDEAQLLEDVLYELRMAFVEVQKRAAAKPK